MFYIHGHFETNSKIHQIQFSDDLKNIYVVDLDTIELSNLNRQFLFRQKDIGKYKADVAKDFIKKKYPDINILSSHKKIQEFADDFFRQFNIIIGGLRYCDLPYDQVTRMVNLVLD